MQPSLPSRPAAVPLPPTLAAGLDIVAMRTFGDNDDAREAVQEILTRLCGAWLEGRVPEGVTVEAYAHGITRHVLADALRARIRDRALHTRISLDVPSRDPDPLEALARSERVASLRAALSRLSAAERGLLDLIYLQGVRMVDIARRTGLPPERLRKRKARALKRLRSLLEASD